MLFDVSTGVRYSLFKGIVIGWTGVDCDEDCDIMVLALDDGGLVCRGLAVDYSVLETQDVTDSGILYVGDRVSFYERMSNGSGDAVGV